MPIDLARLLEDRPADKFVLFERHLNSQLLRMLRTLGFAVDYVRAEGPYLFDAAGDRYLDLLSGFGVFALGRNHPIVIGALEQVLRARLAGLVQLDVPLLAGLLAERLTGYMPWLQSCSCATPERRRWRRRSSSAVPRPAARPSCTAMCREEGVIRKELPQVPVLAMVAAPCPVGLEQGFARCSSPCSWRSGRVCRSSTGA